MQDYLLAMLDLDPGARRLGELGLGLNSGIDRFTGSILYDEKIGGTVHLALGQSYPETGGVNNSALHWDLIVDTRTNGRITADGRLVMENGHWLVGLIGPKPMPTSEIGEPDMRRDSFSKLCCVGFSPRSCSSCLARARRLHAQAAADAALKDRVLQLVDRLDADKVEARDTATASLIKLGPKILPLLPDPATVTSTERKERLGRIRAALPKSKTSSTPARARSRSSARESG